LHRLTLNIPGKGSHTKCRQRLLSKPATHQAVGSSQPNPSIATAVHGLHVWQSEPSFNVKKRFPSET
jgi:hypothetical protein